MREETKRCQNCKNEFVIEPEDFAFYEKIKVPPPTWCPECRFQRRLAFFNLTQLYRRRCDLCGEERVSTYHPKAPYRVYCSSCWWGDAWDPMEYGQEYDFSRPFFDQLNDLYHEAPRLGLSVNATTLIDSPYNNHAGDLKNCYLLFQADLDEDCAYGVIVKNCKSLLDCSLSLEAELCYDSMHSYKNSRSAGLRSQVAESFDCFFLRDCFNCQNCFASANLRNKKYYIFNRPYTKEEYEEEMKKWDLGSYTTYQKAKKLAEEHWKNYPPKPNMDEFSVNSGGSHYFQSKNCRNCFEVTGAEDSKFLFMLFQPPIKDCYDVSAWGNNIQFIYDSAAVGENSAQLKFCYEAGLNAHNLEYCLAIFGGEYNFGCSGLKKRKYCILNKQYSKEEYGRMREKIIAHMSEMPYRDKQGNIYRYGEFFPAEISPYAYNETLAQRFFPLSEEIADHKGYAWRDIEENVYTITKDYQELSDHIKDVSDEVLKEVIRCGQCGHGFRIIPMELGFLRRMNFPLPRQCPNCRITEKFNQWVKNLRVIGRTCDKCGVEFTTNYPKDEVPYILCKKCYQAEVV